MDKIAASSSSSLCSSGDVDDNDAMVHTPTPASPTALAESDSEIAKENEQLLTDNGEAIQEQRKSHENDNSSHSKPSHVNGINSNSPSDNDKSSSNNSASLLSHNNKIRILYFFYRFSTGSLVPFMSLYMQHVGLRPDQIGTLQAIRPIVTMTSAPLWGGVADRTGKKKLVLVGTFFFSFLFRLSACFTSNNIVTFGMSLCISSVFYAPVSSLLDSIVVSSMAEVDKVDFGRFRLYGELGNGVASSILLNIINKSNNTNDHHHHHYHGYNYMFGIHAITSLMAWICMMYCVPSNYIAPTSGTQNDEAVASGNDQARTTPATLSSSSSTILTKTQHHPTPTSDWREGLRVIFSDVQILMVFGLVITMGYSLSILENFCYINIRQLYITHNMLDVAGRDIGLYRICYSIGGTLTWWYAGSLSRKLGSDVVMIISVGCLPLCFFGYAGFGSSGLGVYTKLGIVMAEALRSGIFAALWSTATVRVNKLSPPHVSSQMQTMMEGAYRGIGHTSGSYLGGLLCRTLDTSSAFMAVGKGLVSFLCLIGAMGFWNRGKVAKFAT